MLSMLGLRSLSARLDCGLRQDTAGLQDIKGRIVQDRACFEGLKQDRTGLENTLKN